MERHTTSEHVFDIEEGGGGGGEGEPVQKDGMVNIPTNIFQPGFGKTKEFQALRRSVQSVVIKTQREQGRKMVVATIAINVVVHILGYFLGVRYWEVWPPSLKLIYLTAAVTAYVYYYCCTCDPGFLPRGTKPLTDEIRAKAERHNYKVCETCNIVRPLRSKHCGVCDRCVARYDHHCPFINNCVGHQNNRQFFIFLLGETIQMILAVYLAFDVMGASGAREAIFLFVTRKHIIAFLVIVVIALIVFVVGVMGMAMYRVWFNITTNEYLNQHKYSYITIERRKYHNLFDRGCVDNCVDFWSGADDNRRTSVAL